MPTALAGRLPVAPGTRGGAHRVRYGAMYEITVKRTFAAEHGIRLYDGSVERRHHHDWSVEVTVGAEQLDRIDVVMDFQVLEQRVDDLLSQVESRCLNDVPPFATIDGDLAINPTAERVACWLGSAIAASLPPQVRLLSVTIGEAPGCSARYVPSLGNAQGSDAAD